MGRVSVCERSVKHFHGNTLSMKTNEQIAADLVAAAKATGVDNPPMDFNFPPDDSDEEWQRVSNHKGQLAATAMIEKELRSIGWHPVNLPWDEDGISVIADYDKEALGGIFITINFTMSGDITQTVSRDWLLFNNDWQATAYRALM